MRRTLPALIVAMGLLYAVAGHAQSNGGLAGAYLAARQAVIDGDHRQAAIYFDLAMSADPGNEDLIGNALLAHAALGEWDRALEIAALMPEGQTGRELVNLITQVDRIRRGDFAASISAIDENAGAGPLIDGLSAAWLYLGEGDMSRAVATFEEVAQDTPLAQIARYHLALARAAVGDFEGADAIFSGEAFGPIPATARGVTAHAQVLAQLDRTADALDLLALTTSISADPVLLQLAEELSENPARPYDFVVDAREGAAEVFYSLAEGLGFDGSTALPLVYARAATVIDPEHLDAILLSGDYLLRDSQFPLAEQAFASIPQTSAQYVSAQTGRADALFAMERQDDAIETLRALSASHPDLASVHAALGDLLRRTEDFEQADMAYTAALDLVDQSEARYWFLFYARGISRERLDQLGPSEDDFRKALELSPDQPPVLNYLGYSLVEQRRNLDEALGMIERAVAGQPNSGYIVDSLGWVFYRLGRYEEAVAPMERAVELLPNDPIVNDHLGDVYWQVGRFREAEFQWHRALSFEPEEVEAERIRLKLEIGLDRVLEQEAAAGDTQ